MGEPVKKSLLYGGRFAGLNREYSVEYSGNILGNIPSARLGSGYGSAGLGVYGSARLKYGARVAQSSSTSGRVGCAWAIWLNIQAARVWYPELRFG